MTETIMNLRGLKCPLPALKVKKLLTTLKPGALVIAECTDPMSVIDIPNLVRQTGDELEAKEFVKENGADLAIFKIRKK